MTETDWGMVAQNWLDRLAACSEPGAGVTRLPFTPEHRAALAVLRELMEAAGLAVHLDAAGTLIGRRDGPADAPALLLGSHQDSVREGGAYDGIMGVVLAVLALMKLRQDGVSLPFATEVLAFADEEGVRFPTALMGPRALAGTFDMAALELSDRDGISLRNAMQDFGLNPDALPDLKRDPSHCLGWIECHLEQGPVLEQAQQALGVVSGICGIERHSVTLTGSAAHAGTVPMALRRDALAGAAELVLAVEGVARRADGVLATVGSIHTRPNVVNAVPGDVSLTVEIRAPHDDSRATTRAQIEQKAQMIAADRNLALNMRRSYAQAATPCDTEMTLALTGAVRAGGGTGMTLASGATHDTSAMADLCPVGMIFTACRGGVSHHPDEYVTPDVMAQAVAALASALAQPGFAR
ncbi:M20 family metallo-hydrolase [Roseinatronobacter alkalisoli]|uniref:M20 family metallo-hydrolase n=1 Tax=Roseinatronobacter alkalisoli TaxID=3028235 RepID=A0ABT5TD29_9RHOB|nr:M20 family metallo-hydrolase [Roseinatronobacter sp. HJB301]MDD7971823.1 M20 family metallo-hydrolase [Roseinatronobacter sp. HJB301]